MAVVHSEEAHKAAESERALLGALLRDSAVAWPLVKDIVSPTHIERADHRLIFSAIVELIDEAGVADPALLVDHLGIQLEAAGGSEYICDLYEDCPSPVNARAYALTVRAHGSLGKIVELQEALDARRDSPPAETVAFLTQEAARIQREHEPPKTTPKPERRPMLWASLDGADPPLRSWRISHWLTSGPSLMAGVGGIGKTLLAQTIGTALALGRSFIDDVDTPAKVLIWACEDDHDELWRRQLAICRYFGVPLSALDGKLIVEPRFGRENTLYSLAYGSPVWTPLRDELHEQVNDYGAQVVFLDNIGQLYGGKESERHQVTEFMNGLAGISTALSVIVMGHPAKTSDSEFSGSTAWENSVRMRWYMGHRLPDQKSEDVEEDPNVRFLAKRKANYSDKDFRKLEFRDGLFVPEAVQGPSFAQRWGGADRRASAEECVVRALMQIANAGIRATDGKTSPDYLPKKMREMKLTHDFTAKELSAALSQLRLSGRVVEGTVGKYGNRTHKTGLVVAP